MRFHFQKKYFFLTLLLFIVELLIALYVRDRFIRPYIGDFLVVVFIYCFLRTFWKAKVGVLAASVLVFAYAVELSQYFRLIYLLGLEKSTIATLILGNTFQWGDLLAYTLGIVLVIVLEAIGKVNLAISKR